MFAFIQKHLLTIIGITIGAVAGYVYWRNTGCSSGTCIITSKPVHVTLYGALMGGLIFSMFTNKKIKPDDNDKHN
ncbi:DUF6132 family protein [Ferruginibacter sp. SUN106]|uniref:DUF6132 family protein n=1 Tax=Ferruginibacter sp. SUN106 TaxID=2978348 RepID=UPI003D36F905